MEVIPTIESKVKVLRRILEDWDSITTAIQNSYISKDFDTTERKQYELLDKLSLVYSNLFIHADERPDKTQKDWRQDIELKKLLSRIYTNQPEIEKTVRSKQLQKFREKMDKMEIVIKMIISRLAQLKKEGIDSGNFKVKRKAGFRSKAKSNTGKFDDWRNWVRTKTGEEIKQKTILELYEEFEDLYDIEMEEL